MTDATSLEGRTAIVTGVGPGIGAHVARAFADAGARVVAVARSRATVDDTIDDIASAGGHAVGVAADVGTADGIARVLEVARAKFETVDVLFHNAAATQTVEGRMGIEQSDDEWQACFDVNILAPVRFARGVVPDMKRVGRGSIITVLSTAAFQPIPGISAWAYGSTKAGLAMLTRYLARECGPEVRANAICPGTISATGDPMAMWEGLTARIPLGRFGRADEVVPAALFLASDASSYTTGQVLFVDGGRVNAS